MQFFQYLIKFCLVLGFPLSFFLIGIGVYTLYYPMKMLELLMYVLGILAIVAGLYLMVRLTIVFVKHNDPDPDYGEGSETGIEELPEICGEEAK